MNVTIKGSEMPDMELFTTDEEKDIVQNILCILNTVQGSCPGLRGYGINPEIMHKPQLVARSAYSVSVSQQLALYEPRATLVKLDFEDDQEHPDFLIPILEVTIP